MDKNWGLNVLNALTAFFGSVKLSKRKAFEVLIATILSQHTTDVKAYEAYNSLSRRFNITPEALASASPTKVAEAIRVAGLQWNKAKAIIELSNILKREPKFFEEIGKLDVDEARKRLTDLPGVGEKTADIVLLFSYDKPTFPIDTHIFRVSKRMGLRSDRNGYEKLRKRLLEVFPESSYLEAHILLIRLGREFCKPKKPKCDECPVSASCPKII
ncbi:endonuclease III [Candidatus Bathyarchaeota archaeon]|nr:endonuclease III [Candidatus Bathyarchaeota archaeon]MBS7618202.1 endonuclease III [Candidatus Bathyarchaeota archaeon]